MDCLGQNCDMGKPKITLFINFGVLKKLFDKNQLT